MTFLSGLLYDDTSGSESGGATTTTSAARREPFRAWATGTAYCSENFGAVGGTMHRSDMAGKGCSKIRVNSHPWVTRDESFSSLLAPELHRSIQEGWFMRKSLLVLLCAGLLSEIALPPLAAQSSAKSSSSSRRSRRSRRARNVGIGAAGGAAGGAILGRGRGAAAGAAIGGTAGALTPTRRNR